MKVLGQFAPKKHSKLKLISVAALLSASIYAQAADVDIPAQSLDQALFSLAKQTGQNIGFSTEVANKINAPAIKGNYSVEQALQILLKGSGLTIQKTSVGYSIIKVSENEAQTLSEVQVSDNKEASSNDLPKAYAGGQVARGGKVGILGNKDVMETPFSQTTYTAEHINNTQAVTINEVLESSPSVSRISGRYFANDGYYIRGFPVFGSDISYEGLYGLANTRRNAIEAVERIELLKGPSALLNGVPPGGAIGGNINIVAKRATDKPITDLTLSYLTESVLGAHLDVGRRFGENNAFGVRANLAYRDGDTPFDRNSERATLGALALDYRGDKVRLFANFNYENQHLTAPIFSGLPVNAGVRIPSAPSNHTNFTPPWTYTDTERNFNILKAEYDFAENWTTTLAYGWQHVNEEQYVTFGHSLVNSLGSISAPVINRLTNTDRDMHSTDFKVNGHFSTGSVTHQISTGAYNTFVEQDGLQRQANGVAATSNIYNHQINYPQPSLAGVTPVRFNTEVTMQGIAISDTLGFFEDQLQLTIGARRQTIQNDNKITNVEYDKSATTPAGAIMFKATENLSLYANYIEGLTQAPTPPTTVINFNQVFPPAKSKQKEVGVKYDFGRQIVTFSIFEITQPSGITNTATNTYSVDGEQRNRGAELETFGEIIEGVRLLGGVTYIDPELTKTQGGINQGNEAVNVPNWTVSLSGEWDLPFFPGWTVNGRMVSTSERYVNAANTQQIAGWTRFDLGARYATKLNNVPLVIRASINNVFNRDYWESAYSSSLVLGTPRTLSLSGTFSF